MEDLKKIQEFFSKPLKENIVVRMYNTTDKTADLYKEDNPGLEFYLTGKKGQDYVRKYKDHISFPFSSHMNDGTPIPNYEENKEKLAAYLKQKGIPFKTTSAKPNRGVSRTTGEDFMYTTDTFKVPLSHVDIKDISLEEGILTPDDLASYRDNAMEKLANADIVDKKLGKTRYGDKYIMIMYKEKWDFANPPKTGMYNPETQWVKVFYNDESEIQDLMALKENTTNWPKEVPSRYGDIIFRLVKVMPDRAKYELIDAETGKTWETGGRVYGTVNQLKASAEDTIKPQGGRQSSQFESVFEASLGSTKSQSLANAINSAMLQIDDSMSYTDFANAVASILIDEYGTHNFTPFMEVLHARLGMNESLNEAAEEDKKLTYNNFVQMVRDDMMAGAAPDEYPSDERVRKDAKYLYNRYLQGASVDDLFEATKEEYNALLDKEYELTKAYSKDKTDANWKKLSDIRKKGKKLEKELEDQGLLEASKTFDHSSDEKKKSIAQTLAETIKLGEGVIEEELCPKGKAYIKRRKAAGEKSSAYLSGRAVKVCKGQMSGRKKRKSKKK